MKLNKTQVEQFDTKGYVFLPDVFSAEEIGIINAEVPKIFAHQRAYIFQNSDQRIVFAIPYEQVKPLYLERPELLWRVVSLVVGRLRHLDAAIDAPLVL